MRASSGTGRHRRDTPPRRRTTRTVELVNARDLSVHLLTLNAHETGWVSGEYVALCGMSILPAPLIEPGNARCPRCTTRTIPRQRTG